MLTKVGILQRLPPLRWVSRYVLTKESNLTQEGMSFRERTCCTMAASSLAAVTLDNRGILFTILVGWLSKDVKDPISAQKLFSCGPDGHDGLGSDDSFTSDAGTDAGRQRAGWEFSHRLGLDMDGQQSTQRRPFFTH